MKKHTPKPKIYYKFKAIVVVFLLTLAVLGLEWLAWKKCGFVGVLAVLGLVIWTVVIEHAWLKLARVAIASPKLTKKLRILQISDFHSNFWVLGRILKLAKQQKPDLVVLTGDIFDVTRRNSRSAERLISEVVKIAPTMMIFGNHETECPEMMAEVEAFLKQVGVKHLGQDFVKINDQLVIFGNDYARNPRFEINQQNFNLLLTHSLRRAEKMAGKGYDLILCGHEHGGQVWLPLVGALFDARYRIFPELRGRRIKGLQTGESSIYICSGAGSSPFPIRFLNRVQISLLEISPE